MTRKVLQVTVPTTSSSSAAAAAAIEAACSSTNPEPGARWRRTRRRMAMAPGPRAPQASQKVQTFYRSQLRLFAVDDGARKPKARLTTVYGWSCGQDKILSFTEVCR